MITENCLEVETFQAMWTLSSSGLRQRFCDFRGGKSLTDFWYRRVVRVHTLRLVSCHHLSSEGSFLCTGDPDHVDDRHCTSKGILSRSETGKPCNLVLNSLRQIRVCKGLV